MGPALDYDASEHKHLYLHTYPTLHPGPAGLLSLALLCMDSRQHWMIHSDPQTGAEVLLGQGHTHTQAEPTSLISPSASPSPRLAAARRAPGRAALADLRWHTGFTCARRRCTCTIRLAATLLHHTLFKLLVAEETMQVRGHCANLVATRYGKKSYGNNTSIPRRPVSQPICWQRHTHSKKRTGTTQCALTSIQCNCAGALRAQTHHRRGWRRAPSAGSAGMGCSCSARRHRASTGWCGTRCTSRGCSRPPFRCLPGANGLRPKRVWVGPGAARGLHDPVC